MEYIYVCTVIILIIIIIYTRMENKSNKYWREYWKELYFKEREFVDNYINNHSIKDEYL